MSDWRDHSARASDGGHDAGFRRNLCVIAAIHLGAILAIWFFTRNSIAPPREDVTWIDGGAFAAAEKNAAEEESAPTETEKEMPPPEPEPQPEEPPKAVAPSEIVVPSPTPKPTPEATSTPKPTATPKPKSTPKPTPKATPKPSPKTSPKPKPKPKPSASAKKSASPKPKSSASPNAATAKKSAESEEKKDAFLAAHEGETGTAAGSGGGNRGGAGHAGGGSKQTDFGWYHSLIHDRFYSRWDQPTSIMSSDQKFVTTVKIRIEKDGRISNVSLANSSGNVVMDESVMAAARRVTQIDPLPAGLGGEFYEVKINFELSQENQ